MSFALTGPVTLPHTGTTTTTNLAMTSTVPEGSVVITAMGNDSATIGISSLSDNEGNTHDFIHTTSGSGCAGIGWGDIATQLASGDNVTIAWGSSCDAMARGYAFTGLGTSEVASGTKTYTESTTYSLSLNNSSGDNAVMFAVFVFPFDFGVSDTPTGWTKFADITDTADQQLLGFYKEIGTGVNTCTETVGTTVAYYAAGVILPYAAVTSTGGRRQVIAFL